MPASTPTLKVDTKPDSSMKERATAAEDATDSPAGLDGPLRFSAVVLGSHAIRPWYSSSYPKDLPGELSLIDPRLYVCEYCFKYTVDVAEAIGHQKHCSIRSSSPLGYRVYHRDGFSIYEIDGEQHLMFCQNLSLFARLFLDTKSICYDVESFLFYTLVEDRPDAQTERVVGFFSKEKVSWDDYNLACILVFPPYQRRGLGRLLISFSYELSKIDRRIGTPEKPLSDLGRHGYMKYWSNAVIEVLSKSDESVTVEEISASTFVHPEDVVATLRALGAQWDTEGNSSPSLRLNTMKQRRNGQQLVNVSDKSR